MCPPTDSSLGGYGILPYPRRLLWDILPRNTPNSQNLLLRRASHGFHRFTQMLRVRFVPTEFTESTEFGSVGMAGMPYPPTSVRIRAHLWEAFLCKRFCEFRAFCGNIFSPTDFTDLHRYLGCAILPQNSQNSQNLAAWVWQGCHTLLHLCASVSSVGVLSLQEVLCVRCIPWELLHRLFCWCSRDCCTPWRNPRK